MKLNDAMESVARSLRDFGYPDVTAQMIRECYDAWEVGDAKLPHGIIGMMAKAQFDECADALRRLKR